jgi:hypothetical protein
MNFSLMRSKPEYPEECFANVPRLGAPWVFGERLAAPPVGPLDYVLASDHQEPPYLLYELPHPLIRKSLLEQIVAAGVDNVETFDAVLHHPLAGVLPNEYVAFNIIGLIATTELAARAMQSYVEFEFQTDEVEGLIPDYSRIPPGILLARFADRMGRILVSNSLRDRIDPGPESGLVFFELADGRGALD